MHDDTARGEDDLADGLESDNGDTADELMPGEIAAGPAGELWSGDAAEDPRGRWRQLQLRFVDDPHGAVTEAQVLVADAVKGLTAALSDRRRELDGWGSAGNGDTEALRVALQRYRELFDRIVGR